MMSSNTEWMVLLYAWDNLFNMDSKVLQQKYMYNETSHLYKMV